MTKEVSFSNPFFDEMSKYAVKFAVPVFFGDSPHFSFGAKLGNGTATLIRLGQRFCAVTCSHVLEGYRKSAGRPGTVFQLGPVRVEPDAYLISEDPTRDLAILDLSSFVGKSPDLTEGNFVEPRSWPPGPVSKDDVLCLAGFPGIWREQVDLGHLRFYSFSSGTSEVVSARDDLIVTTVQIDECITQINHGKLWGFLGGLSGGPVFAWRKTPILIAELVGFIYEYQESLDLMYVRAAGVIRQDGTLS